MAYVKSDDVQKREKDYYDYLKNNNPGEFSSEYTDKANAALAEIENMGDFKYNPATDIGYQAARKQYTAGGQQAMKDTLGTATELTGGYDNSYAQVAAQQTFNNYMSELANMMPQFENQAYGRYQDQRNQKIDYYGILENARQRAYNEHMDAVNRYNMEADRLYGLYSDAYNKDYTAYRDSVADQQYADEFAYRQGQDAIANDQWERNFAHGVAMDNAAAETAYLNALSDEELAAEGYEYAGIAYEYTPEGERIEVGRRYIKDGKEYVFDKGLNPNAFNADMPDNINGVPLKKTELMSDDNGELQYIYTTGDGKYWLWNDKMNNFERIANPYPNAATKAGQMLASNILKAFK